MLYETVNTEHGERKHFCHPQSYILGGNVLFNLNTESHK